MSLRVGLTGGVASGKSTVASMLGDLGAFVSRSDEIARLMMEPGQALFRSIAQHFGREVLQADGRLDRRVLARIAFVEGRVQELNDLVHPPVIAAQELWMQSVAKSNPEAVIVVESALLLETRHGGSSDPGMATHAGLPPDSTSEAWRTRFDRILLVTAAQTLRTERYVQRVLASDPAGDRLALARDAHLRFAVQMPEEQKAALADAVIQNDGSMLSLRALVEESFRGFEAEARGHRRDAMSRAGSGTSG